MARALPPGIRQKRPGYYEVRVYGGKDPLTGRQRQVSRAVRGTLKEAKALRAALVVEVETQGVAANSSVAELFEAVIQHLESIGREATTIVGYRQIAKDAGAQFGSTSLRKLRASHLDGYYGHMLKTGRSPATVKRHHAFIRRSLKQAYKWGWVQENVADRASPPSEPKRIIELQTDEAIIELIAEADKARRPELGVAMRLLASTGGRRGEVCGLKWKDFDPESGVCRIRRAVKHANGEIIIGDVKTHQERSLQLDDGTMVMLATHKKLMTKRARIAGQRLSPEAFILSESPNGSEPWQPNKLTQAFGRLRKRTGFTGRLQDLRHWHASRLLNAGEAPVVVAQRLGHGDPATTHKWYAHAMPRGDRRAADLIGGVLDVAQDGNS